jgi:hypothetical protein
MILMVSSETAQLKGVHAKLEETSSADLLTFSSYLLVQGRQVVYQPENLTMY